MSDDREPRRPLVRGSMQWTEEQFAFLQEEARRLGLGSVPAVARMIVQEAMNARYRATTRDEDTAQ